MFERKKMKFVQLVFLSKKDLANLTLSSPSLPPEHNSVFSKQIVFKDGIAKPQKKPPKKKQIFHSLLTFAVQKL